MPNNTVINLSKIKNNDLMIYLLMSLVVIGIIYIPKQKNLLKLFNNGNISTLMISLACICLLMLIDNRIAVLSLVLIIIIYYESKKQNINQKIEKAISENNKVITATKLNDNLIETTDNFIGTNETNPETEIETETDTNLNSKTNNISMISILSEQQEYTKKLKEIISSFKDNLNIPKYEEYKGPKLEEKELEEKDNTKKTILPDRIPEVVKENFPRDGIPSYSRKEKPEIFKENEKIKNINNLLTQNEINGASNLDNNSNPFTNILNGPPLSKNEIYSKKQTKFVNTEFYPLNM